jgi:hypothetical protein
MEHILEHSEFRPSTEARLEHGPSLRGLRSVWSGVVRHGRKPVLGLAGWATEGTVGQDNRPTNRPTFDPFASAITAVIVAEKGARTHTGFRFTEIMGAAAVHRAGCLTSTRSLVRARHRPLRDPLETAGFSHPGLCNSCSTLASGNGFGNGRAATRSEPCDN